VGAGTRTNVRRGMHMDEQRQPDKPEKEPQLRRPDEAIKDLEPDQEEGDAVKGGSSPLNYQKV
jgi:hypothetical protein